MGQLYNKNSRKSPSLWCEEYGIKIVSLEKQWTEKEFIEEKIDLEEFLNKAAGCVLIPSDDKSRRKAFELKKKLLKNLK